MQPNQVAAKDGEEKLLVVVVVVVILFAIIINTQTPLTDNKIIYIPLLTVMISGCGFQYKSCCKE